MKTTLTLSPVDRGRREPQDAASALTYIFVPHQPAPKPHPDFNLSGLFVGLIYSFLVAGFFTGLGYGAYLLLQKVWDWL
jgi:hypothetical protein